MARGRGSIIVSVIREMELAGRRQQIAERRLAAANAKALRVAEKISRQQAAYEEKERKRLYLEARQDEVDILNQELATTLSDLKGILEHTLKIDDRLDFNSLRIKTGFPSFLPPSEFTVEETAPVLESFTTRVNVPGFIGKFLPWIQRNYEKKLADAISQYESSAVAFRKNELEKKEKLTRLMEAYNRDKDAYLAKVKQRDIEVDELRDRYAGGEEDAVVTYNTMVLERSFYPEDFPQEFMILYQNDSKQMIIEYRMPDINFVPKVLEFSYVKSKDEIREKAMKANERREIYTDVVAAVAIRTIHEVFEADHHGHIDVVVLNGYVETIDPSTGQDVKPYLLSVRATKDQFLKLVLDRIDKVLCLRNLGAQVSPQMNEKVPIKPLVDFNMSDRRFVQEDDIMNALEQRPNIFDLNPFEFEHLVTNLFSNMGFEAKLTRSSRDGGVDCVAFDTRPLLGGKVVIQAKRWSNVVGVSAVRDLYGTMINEGASKGILVTTSHYGPDAYEFASNKPIELIDGGNLLYFLNQAGIKAKIVPPNA